MCLLFKVPGSGHFFVIVKHKVAKTKLKFINSIMLHKHRVYTVIFGTYTVSQKIGHTKLTTDFIFMTVYIVNSH